MSAVRSVAVVFDDTLRSDTTGVHCLRALARLMTATHLLPSQLSAVKPGDFDLFVRIDDGMPLEWPTRLRPSACWLIDTHLDFEARRCEASRFDFVFAAQRNGAQRLLDEGIAQAKWMPLACDPEIHRRHDVPNRWDLGFVGRSLPGRRSALISLLESRYPRSYFGHAYGDELAATYSASHLAFNCAIVDDINMRVFEAMGCGVALVTNNLADNGQAELFRDGFHLLTYVDDEEMLDKVAFYLKHPDARGKIARQGQTEVYARHTYCNRMQAIIDAVASDRRFVSVPGTPSEQTSMLVSAENASGPVRHFKDRSYYLFPRADVMELIPTSARRVLDIGCGAGRLGEAIKARQKAVVWGVELDPVAAKAAEQWLDKVFCIDVESDEWSFEGEGFDCIIVADVIEHLRWPERLLSKIRRILGPEGLVVASIPNVRNHSVLTALLQGNWTYEAAGLLDHTHLRFFTRREIEKLFYRQGLEIVAMQMVPDGDFENWSTSRNTDTVRFGALAISGMPVNEAQEFYAYQYLVAAKQTRQSDYGLTSIVILTHNQLPFTRMCLNSIRMCTDDAYEVIVVDNASTDGTREYLRALEGVRLIENDQNRGFPAGVNQGLQVARGQQLVLLNNDTIVTTGWLRRLLDCLHSDANIGLVGPVTNCASGIQCIQIPYSEQSLIDGFAWDWAKANPLRRIETERLVGFCLLARRSLVDAIGGLDERFGIGNFEDDDYCLRAGKAGFRCVVAADVFVHHFGGRTFKASGIDFNGLIAHNQRLFEDKWRADGQPQTTVAESPQTAAARMEGFRIECDAKGALSLKPHGPRISLCMIVRDNERTIGDALESIKPWVDEIVVVDTGSQDRTREIALGYGARLFEFPWCDSFAIARNESLRHAQGQWLVWMDSDDTISPENGQKLRALLSQPVDAHILGYIMQVHCPNHGPDGDGDATIVDHVKVFRNRPDLRFEGRIHEQIMPAIRRAGGDVAWTDIYVTHSGADQTAEGRKRKQERDLRLLRLEETDRPDNSFVLFNIGMTFADMDDHENAIVALERSIAVGQAEESHRRKAYALLVASHSHLARFQEAEDVCRSGLAEFPLDVELLFREGFIAQHLGQLERAADGYRRALSAEEGRHFSSVDKGLRGYKTRQNLAIVYEQLQQYSLAEDQWRLIIAEIPNYRDGWRGLTANLIAQRKLDRAMHEVDRMLSHGLPATDAHLIRSQIASGRGHLVGAQLELERGLEIDGANVELLDQLCKLLFECGQLLDAERRLRELVTLAPDNGSAWHNLGSVNLQLKNHDAAKEAFRKAVDLRPSSAVSHLYLGFALKEFGDIEAARTAWRYAIEVAPNDPAAREAESSLQMCPDSADCN